MSIVLPLAIGIAKISCVVLGSHGDSPRAHLDVSFSNANTASLTLSSPEGATRLLSDAATVAYDADRALRITTPSVDVDFSLPENQNSCFVISSNWLVDLKETSFASFEGQLQEGIRLDMNPKAKGPCAVPMMSMPPVLKVRCAAAVH